MLPDGISFWQAYLYAMGSLLAFSLGMRFSILIHELGHAVAGRMRGFQFSHLLSGRLWINRRNGSLSIRRQHQFRFPGGFCLSVPPPDATRNDLLWFIAGGPIASATLAFLGIAVAWSMGPQTGYLGIGAKLVFGMTGVASALLFATSVFWPAPSSGLIQDGARIRMLWRDEVAVSSELAALRLFGLTGLGVRPRDWPTETLEQVDAKGTDRLRWMRASAEVGILIDRDEHVQALAHSEELMSEAESMTPVERKLYALTHSLLIAHVKSDGENARKWLNESQGCLVESHQVLTAEAAVLHAEGATDEALATVDRARAAWEDALFPLTDGSRELLAAVEAKMRTQELAGAERQCAAPSTAPRRHET